MDVHDSPGLGNNWFYLLANGGTDQTSGIALSGIGISKAERIRCTALTGYMTWTTTFAGARTATVNAATQLHGSASVEVQRVKDAWTAVGVYWPALFLSPPGCLLRRGQPTLFSCRSWPGCPVVARRAHSQTEGGTSDAGTVVRFHVKPDIPPA
jgi:hypothetical protein